MEYAFRSEEGFQYTQFGLGEAPAHRPQADGGETMLVRRAHPVAIQMREYHGYYPSC